MTALVDLLPAFRAYLRAEKLAEPTAYSYGKEVRYALVWMGEDLGRPAQVADLTEERLQRYQLACGHKAAETIGQMISALRAYCRVLKKQGLLSVNPALALDRPRTAQRLPAVLSEDQADALCAAPLLRQPEGRFRLRKAAQGKPVTPHREDYKTPLLRIRDVAALEIWYAGGLRRGELLDLQMADLTFGHDADGRPQVLLHVHGKGRKDRRVPYQGKALAAIQDYLARRGELKPTCSAFLISRRGGALRSAALQDVVYRWAAAIGLRCHPHLLRHTCATHLIRSGAVVALVKEFLGHASLHTLTKYVHLASWELGPGCAAKHPHGRVATTLALVEGPLKEALELVKHLSPAQLVLLIQAAAVRLGQIGLPPKPVFS